MSVLPQLERELVAAHRRLHDRPRRGLRGSLPTRASRIVRWLSRAASAIPALLAVAAIVTVALVGLSLRHGSTEHPAGDHAGGPSVVAQAPDPQAGVPWALRIARAGGGKACLQVGRLLPATTDPIGRRTFSTDANLTQCAVTDGHGHAFLNVFARRVPVRVGGDGAARDCAPPGRPSLTPTCPLTDLRNLAYGLLGPEARSITYTVNGRDVSKRTGTDGAYLVVLPATAESCVLLQGAVSGRSCEAGSGETSTLPLQSGVITAVTYRDGHVCRLPPPASQGVLEASCPPVGYVAAGAQAVSPAQVASHIAVRKFPAHEYCLGRRTQRWITCDGRVPPGYVRVPSQHGLLIDITFVARKAAGNGHSNYEWALTQPAGRSCAGAEDRGTTGGNVAAGQFISVQDFLATGCHGVITGIITYQPHSVGNNWTLSPNGPIRDGSILVARFSFLMA